MTSAATFRVIAQPHPFRSDATLADMACDCSLADLGAGGAVAAWVDGERCEDTAYLPREGQEVVLRAVPQGGGGKDPLRLAATLALTFFAPTVGGYLHAAAGFGTAAAWTGVAGVVGNLAVNALVPPSTQNLDSIGDFTPFRGIPSTSNELRPFGVIPRLYGTHRIYPPMASRPYSEQVGTDTYIRVLLCAGHGPLQIAGLTPGLHSSSDDPTSVPATVRIGDTSLTDFADWELEWLPGTDADPPLTLYSRNISQQNLADLFDEDAEMVTRTTSTAGQITLDFNSPAIVRIASSGNQRPASVALKIEIRVAGTADPWQEVTPPDVLSPGPVSGVVSGSTAAGYSGNWPWVDGSAPGGETVFGQPTAFDPYSVGQHRAYYLVGSEVKPQTLGVTITPPSSGAWDVRVTRIKTAAQNALHGVGPIVAPPENVSGEIYGDFTWTALRSIGADIAQTVPDGLAFLALRIRVSDQIAGGVDTVSVVASALIPVPDGMGGWTLAASSNPAWVYRDVLTGTANARPLADARIDDTALAAWAANCTTDDCEFNAVFDGRTTVFEAIKNVATPGRASRSIRDGLFTVVEDRPGATPVQLFTDRNSWDFSATKVFTSAPHALKIKFKDRDSDWQDSERIVYADGYSEDGAGGTEVATEFEQMVLFGVTDPDRVHKDGRYFQAVAKLRPETATWTADIEHMVARRGDVVRRSADAMLLGLGAARIKAIGSGTITVDERFTIQVTKSYQVRIRKADGTQALASVTNEAGTYTTLTLSGGVPAGVAVGDLVAFGELNLVTQDWLITAIEPIEDLKARIVAVPYSSPAVFEADSGPIPDYDPLVTRPQLTPPEPVILNVGAGADAAMRTNTGALVYRILASYLFPASDVPAATVEAALLRDGEARWESRPGSPNTGLYVFLVPDGSTGYRIRLRGVSAEGVAGPWAEATVDGDDFAGELQGIALQEQRNTPSTPNGDLSTVIATVTPPEDTTGYSHAIVEYHRDGLVGWLRGGVTDAENNVRVILPANGETFTFRARAVSDTGVEDTDGPTEDITLSDAGSPAPDPDAGAPTTAALNVANLRIAGELPAETEWSGRHLRMQWDAGMNVSDYRVRVFSTGGSPQFLRLAYVAMPYFEYSYEQNSLDSAAAGLSGPQREVLIEVIARNVKGQISATPAEKTVINPAPELPGDFTITTFFSAIELDFSRPTDEDFAGVSVHLSETNGFVPDASNLVYFGDTTVPVVIQNLEGSATRYLRVVLRDDFGPGTPSLQYTATLQELPWEDDTPPDAVTGLTLRSEVQETDLMVTAALIAEWDASSDNSGKLFYEIEHWIEEDEPTADTNNSDEEEVYALAMYVETDPYVMAYGDDGAGDAVAGGLFRDSTVATTYTVFPAQVGKTYKFRVRAIDYSGNASAWSTTVEHTIAGDAVPPAAPTGLTATGGIDKITARWTNPPDSDFLQTRVHRGTTEGFTPGPSNLIATTRGDVFVDTSAAADTNYYYKVVALDVSGNASAASAVAGPAQTVKFNSVNVSQFMAPGAIDETQLAADFVQRVDDAEAAIDDNVDQINAIQAQLTDIISAPEFDSGNTYVIDEIVTYEGAIYRAIDNMPTPPAPLPTDTDYWQKIGDYSSLGEAVAANSAAISVLQTDVTNAEGDIATNAAAITGLISDVTDLETEQSAQATAIETLNTTVTTQGAAITANAAAVDAVEADLTALDGEVTANANAIDVLETTVTQNGDDIEANAANIIRLEADLTVPTFALQGNDGGAFALAFGDDGDGEAVALGSRTATSEAIETLQVTVAAQGDTLVSQASAITALQSGLADAEADIAGNATAISGLSTTVTAQGASITANSAAITALESDIGTAEGAITANATAISALETEVSNQGDDITAISASVTTLTTQVGTNTASISTQAASIGGIEANWAVRVDINNRVTGIGLIAGGAETIFGVTVDRFVIVDPDDDSEVAPFEVSGGNTYIKTAFIRNLDAGQITSGSIATDRLIANILTALQLNVSTLSAIRADLGTITAGTITGVLVRTAASGARVEMSTPNGLRTINSGGTTTAQLNVDGSGFFGVGGSAISWNTAGAVTVPGTLIAGDIIGNTFKTGTSGWRVEIGPSLTGATVLRYTNGTDTRLSLSQTGDLELTGTITGSTIQTSASGARVVMSAVGGFQSINASSQIRAHFRVDGSGFVGLHPTYGTANYLWWNSTGGLTFEGTTVTGGVIRTASSGRRAELTAANNDIRFFDSGGTQRIVLGDGSFAGVPSLVYAAPSNSHVGVFVNANSTGWPAMVAQQAGSTAALQVVKSSGAGGSTAALLVTAPGRGVEIEFNVAGVNSGEYHVVLEPNGGAGGAAPTHSAPGGSMLTRVIGGNEARLYYQRTYPSGNNWVRLD
jgi:uncharacterized coiled-coil protein SlyX